MFHSIGEQVNAQHYHELDYIRKDSVVESKEQSLARAEPNVPATPSQMPTADPLPRPRADSQSSSSRASIAPILLAPKPSDRLDPLTDMKIKPLSANMSRTAPALGLGASMPQHSTTASAATLGVSASANNIISGVATAEQKIAMLITLNDREIKAAADKAILDQKALIRQKPAIKLKGNPKAAPTKGKTAPLTLAAATAEGSRVLNMNSISSAGVDDDEHAPPSSPANISRSRSAAAKTALVPGMATFQLPPVQG